MLQKLSDENSKVDITMNNNKNYYKVISNTLEKYTIRINNKEIENVNEYIYLS